MTTITTTPQMAAADTGVATRTRSRRSFAVKVMQRFFDEIVAGRRDIPTDVYHALYADAFDLVNEELAPYALDLVLAVVETEGDDRSDPPGERRRSPPGVAP